MQDHKPDIEKLLQQCATMSEEELIRDVYVDFQFDLCRACQKQFIAAPLGAGVVYSNKKKTGSEN